MLQKDSHLGSQPLQTTSTLTGPSYTLHPLRQDTPTQYTHFNRTLLHDTPTLTGHSYMLHPL